MQKITELLFFQAGAMQLGMDLAFVISIQSAPDIASEQVNKHNRFAPMTEDQDIMLYNLSAILENENSSADPDNEKLIVVNTQDRPAGLIVERVHRVVKVDIDRIEPLSPIFRGPALSCFPRVLKHEDSLVLLMDPQGMVDVARQMQKSQDLMGGVYSKNKEESRSEIESADTVIAEMILRSRQNSMKLGIQPEPHMNPGGLG